MIPTAPSENQDNRLREILSEALQMTDTSERNRFLDKACDGDHEFRGQMDSLIQAYGKADGFLEQSVFGDDINPAEEGPGTIIRQYRLVEELGEGGFGVVYLAEQEVPIKRQVALKIIKLGMDTRQVIARFEAERQALAMMDHPNIARVFEAGATETGRPYFVMERVRGQPITEFCDAHSMSTSERLELFLQVCDAVQHAHQKGIIHRDIKPSNVVVSLQGVRPQAKVIDFGIAKSTRNPFNPALTLTRKDLLLGTPSYMSPEQAEMGEADVDTRSDVYSLGALLYELLTGSPPFGKERLQHAALDEVRRVIREEEPVKPSTRIASLQDRSGEIARQRGTEPSTLRRSLLGDLDWILIKALEKDRTRRYETVNALTLDIQRFKDHEPVRARPPSITYLCRRWIRRHKIAFAMSSVVAIALILVAVVSLVSSYRLRQTLAREYLRRGQSFCERGTVASGLHWMVRALEETPPGDQPLKRVITENLAIWGKQWVEPSAVLFHDSVTYCGAFSPDNQHLIVGKFDGGLTLWSIPDGKRLWEQDNAHDGLIQTLVFSPDGTRILSAGEDGKARLWLTATGNAVGRSMPHFGGDFGGTAFSPNGRNVSVIGTSPPGFDLRLMVAASVDDLPESGQSIVVIAKIDSLLHFRIFAGQGERIVDVDETELSEFQNELDHLKSILPSLWDRRAFPEATKTDLLKTVVSITHLRAQAARLYSADTGEPITPPMWHQGGISRLAFSPDGKLVLTASWDKTARFWSVETGKRAGPVLQHDSGVQCVAFSKDGGTVATGCSDGSIHLWSVATGERSVSQQRHDRRITDIDFHPDGSRIVTSSGDHTARIWSATNGIPIGLPMRHSSWVQRVSFSPDGRQVLTAGGDSIARLWSSETGKPLGSPLRHQADWVLRARFSPNGEHIFTVDVSHAVYLWPGKLDSASVLEMKCSHGTSTARPSPDGALVATGNRRSGHIQFWDAFTGERRTPDIFHAGGVWMLQFNPQNNQQLLTGGVDGVARLWDVSSGQSMGSALKHQDDVRAVTYSNDGRLVATGSWDGTAAIWLSKDGSLFRPPLKHPDKVEDIAFSPDSKFLVTACIDHALRVWSVETGRQVLQPLRREAALLTVDISPDGRLIAAGGYDSVVRFWNLKGGQPTGIVLVHDGYVENVTFSADGRWVMTASRDSSVRIWSVETGELIGPSLFSDVDSHECVFTPDGKRAILAYFQRGAHVLDLPRSSDQGRRHPRLWIEVITRMKMDEQGIMTWIDPEIWERKRDQLARLSRASIDGLKVP